MVDKAILIILNNYFAELGRNGILVEKGVVFGSYARGDQTKESDIDVLVVSPIFDGHSKNSDLLDTLWRVRRHADIRIEPIAVGVREFDTDDESPLIGIARREGVEVPFGPHRGSGKAKAA
mgnify:CR=1 FL=1